MRACGSVYIYICIYAKQTIKLYQRRIWQVLSTNIIIDLKGVFPSDIISDISAEKKENTICKSVPFQCW